MNRVGTPAASIQVGTSSVVVIFSCRGLGSSDKILPNSSKPTINDFATAFATSIHFMCSVQTTITVRPAIVCSKHHFLHCSGDKSRLSISSLHSKHQSSSFLSRDGWLSTFLFPQFSHVGASSISFLVTNTAPSKNPSIGTKPICMFSNYYCHRTPKGFGLPRFHAGQKASGLKHEENPRSA